MYLNQSFVFSSRISIFFPPVNYTSIFVYLNYIPNDNVVGVDGRNTHTPTQTRAGVEEILYKLVHNNSPNNNNNNNNNNNKT